MRQPWGSAQVPRAHYFDSTYLAEARYLGLRAQLDACLALGIDATFLEIGPGPGMLVALLHHFGRQVVTMDFASDLSADVLGRLPELPFRDKVFEVVVAFEVLEHLPLDLVGPSLQEMRRLATRKIIVSVPDQAEIHDGSFSIRITLGNRDVHKVFWRKPLGRVSNPLEHYWEIGVGGISPQTIIDIGQGEGLVAVRNYFVPPWFRFLVFDVLP